MCFSAFVGVEGFTLPGRFIVKELTLLFTNGEFNHTLFAPPLDFHPTNEDLSTIKYTTNTIHGLTFTEGDMPHIKLQDVLGRLEDCKVLCYGEHTRKLIQNYIPFNPVVDVQRTGFVMPKQLPPNDCGRNHPGRNCSMSKAQAVKTFYENLNNLT